jgi:translation initiation factor IF-3
MTLSEAVSEAVELDLDPVIVSRDTNPMVVKLMDQGKAKHEKLKKQKESVKKSVTTTTKEIRIGLRIGQHDLDLKLKQAREFLEKGNRVKIFVQLRGADYYNCQDQACEKVEEVVALLSTVATREGKAAEFLGRMASAMLVPAAKKPTAAKQPPRPPPPAGAAATPTPPTRAATTQPEASGPANPSPEAESPGRLDKQTQQPPTRSPSPEAKRPAGSPK